MRKSQLIKSWKQLDGACEALERLEEEGMETGIDVSAIVYVKNRVEEMIEQKSRGKVEDLK